MNATNLAVLFSCAVAASWIFQEVCIGFSVKRKKENLLAEQRKLKLSGDEKKYLLFTAVHNLKLI